MRAPRRARSHVAGAVAGCGLMFLLAGAAAPAAGAFRPAAPLSAVVIANIGPGYTVSEGGPLDLSRFAADAPDPAAAETTVSTLAKPIATYERVWQADGGRNQVQDLLVHFPDAAGARVFLQAAQHSLDSGEVVGSDPLPAIPGARRVTYFGAADRDGLGMAITMRAGQYVDLLVFFSTATGNAQPISPAVAERVARAQHAALVAAPGGTEAATAGAGPKKRVSVGTIGLAVVVVAVLALAVATPALLRRRRATPVPAAHVTPRGSRQAATRSTISANSAGDVKGS